jgi:hypothetical protein
LVPAFSKGQDARRLNMSMNTQNVRKSFWAAGLAVILLALPIASAAVSADQDIQKKVEAYLGQYEFDLSAMGGGIRVFQFYVKDNAFWVEYGYTSPGELKPVEGAADTFSFMEPDDGLTKFTFQKDDAGQYTKVRMVVASLSVDVVGTKKK